MTDFTLALILYAVTSPIALALSFFTYWGVYVIEHPNMSFEKLKQKYIKEQYVGSFFDLIMLLGLSWLILAMTLSYSVGSLALRKFKSLSLRDRLLQRIYYIVARKIPPKLDKVDDNEYRSLP